MAPLTSRSVRSPVMELPQVLLSMEVVLLPAQGLLVSVMAPLPSLKTYNMSVCKNCVDTIVSVKDRCYMYVPLLSFLACKVQMLQSTLTY